MNDNIITITNDRRVVEEILVWGLGRRAGRCTTQTRGHRTLIVVSIGQWGGLNLCTQPSWSEYYATGAGDHSVGHDCLDLCSRRVHA